MENINETKNWFFEKRAQTNKIRNEKEVMTNTTEIQKNIKEHYK